MPQSFSTTLIRVSHGEHKIEIHCPERIQCLSAHELSQYIDELSKLRLQMLPVVAIDFPHMEGMQYVADDPPWVCAYDQTNNRSALVIRHPGYGWVGFSLPLKSAETLIARLNGTISKQNNL